MSDKGKKIPDEWFENDNGPSTELKKLEPKGFTDRLVDKYKAKEVRNVGASDVGKR